MQKQRIWNLEIMLVKRNSTLTGGVKDCSLESGRPCLCVLRDVHSESLLVKRGKQDVAETCHQMLLSENMFFCRDSNHRPWLSNVSRSSLKGFFQKKTIKILIRPNGVEKVVIVSDPASLVPSTFQLTQPMWTFNSRYLSNLENARAGTVPTRVVFLWRGFRVLS